jgi:hypothetical protein
MIYNDAKAAVGKTTAAIRLLPTNSGEQACIPQIFNYKPTVVSGKTVYS